jgi:hypothetical protein
MNPTKLVMFTLTEDQAAQLSAPLDAISAKLARHAAGWPGRAVGGKALPDTHGDGRAVPGEQTDPGANDGPSSGFADIVVRVPPVTGQCVPVAAFERLVEEKAGRRQWRGASRRRPRWT